MWRRGWMHRLIRRQRARCRATTRGAARGPCHRHPGRHRGDALDREARSGSASPAVATARCSSTPGPSGASTRPVCSGGSRGSGACPVVAHRRRAGAGLEPASVRRGRTSQLVPWWSSLCDGSPPRRLTGARSSLLRPRTRHGRRSRRREVREALFGEATLRDPARRPHGSLFNATSLQTGSLWRFSKAPHGRPQGGARASAGGLARARGRGLVGVPPPVSPHGLDLGGSR